MGKMKWRYLKKYYGRLSLRRELIHVFSYICKQLGLTQQECFLMLLLVFAEVGRWLSPDDIRRVASNAYTMLLGTRVSNKRSSGDSGAGMSGIRLNLGDIEFAEEEEIEEILDASEGNESREESSAEEEERVLHRRVAIGNEVVEDWLEKLKLILARRLKEYYILYKENERLKKKSRELKATLDEVMDYILSHDPELYIKISSIIKKRGLDLGSPTKAERVTI